MYQPRHRAQRLRLRLPSATAAVLTLCVVGALAPAAYADGPGGRPAPNWLHHSPAHHQTHPTKPAHPTKPDGAGNGSDNGDQNGTDGDQNDTGDDTSGAVTNGGHPLAQDAGMSLSQLTPTPAPVTPYELPFPCGETWTGDTHAGHTPSIRAVDFNAPGDFGKPVVAAAAGVVTTAVTGMHRPSYGQYVVIDHGNGESTLYGHLNSVQVTVGQQLAAGTQIGTLGSTGNSTGPHLHFEERSNSAVVDAWFHGVKLAFDVPTVSQNCGGAPVLAAPQYAPLAGNMYGTPQAEVALFSRQDPANFLVTRTGKSTKTITMGVASDEPVLGDWDGDGKVNPGVRTPSTRTFTMRTRGHTQTIRFGKTNDIPLAGNWDGSGAWEVGVRRANSATFKLRLGPGQVKTLHLGDVDDLPVTGDWNGDGITDLGAYDSATATFTLEWTDAAGVVWTTQVVFGSPGDLPVAGDWDGNGVTDLGTWSPTTLLFSERTAATPTSVAAKARRVSVTARHH